MSSKLSIMIIWICFILLLAIGMVMVASTSVCVEKGDDVYSLLRKQIQFGILGFIGAIILSHIDYRIFRKCIVWIWSITLILLICCFLPGIGHEANGEFRWVRFGSFQFQPSECAKICMVMTLAHWYAKNKEVSATFWKGFVLPGILFGIPLLAIFFEKDMGTAAALAMAGFGVMYVAGARRIFIALAIVAGAFVLYWQTTSSPNRMMRIHAWKDPELYSNFSGRQQWISILAMARGGITGVGLGDGLEKHGNLPFAHTDFIFAEIGEELGIVGTLSVVLLFSFFAFFGIAVALQTTDRFGRLLAVGIVAIIFWPAMLNIAVVTSLVPNSGLPLPLISCGGTNLVFTMGSIGILTSIQRRATLPPEKYTIKHRDENGRILI